MTPHEALGALAVLANDPAHLVPSPCISICRIDPRTGWCQGCYRNIDEIVAWGRMPEPGKRAVWRHITQRAGLPQD